MKDFYSTLLAEAGQEEADNGWLLHIQEASLEQIQRLLGDSLAWDQW